MPASKTAPLRQLLTVIKCHGSALQDAPVFISPGEEDAVASLAFSKSKLVEEARQAMDAMYRWGWAEWGARWCSDVQAGE